MAKPGDNNPRAFGDTVSLDAWRTPFDGQTGEADLHINLVFSDGRIGGTDSPVRFRLQLHRAEVHVIRDSGGVLDIKRKTVKSSVNPTPQRALTDTFETEVNLKAGVSLEDAPGILAEASKKVNVKRQIESKDQGNSIRFVAMRTPDGYKFKCDPTEDDLLSGSPWSHEEPFLTMVDTGHKRARGEPPELRVELRCRREDMAITDLVVLSKGRSTMAISADKQLILNQYIKDELLNNGFLVGDVAEPFSEITIADVSPREER